MINIHVDDSIEMGNKDFFETRKLRRQCFESKPREGDKLTFAGINITKQGKSYLLHRTIYVSRLKELSHYCCFDKFRARRRKIAWLTHTRLDLCARAATMSRGTAEKFSCATSKLANSTVKIAKERKEWGLRPHALDKNTLRINMFPDSSFVSNDGMRTSLGYAVLMTDHTKRMNWLTNKIY